MKTAKEKQKFISQHGNEHSSIGKLDDTASVDEPIETSSFRRSDERSLISSSDRKGRSRGSRRSSDRSHVSRQSRSTTKTLNDVIAITILQNESDTGHNRKQPAASAKFILKDLEKADNVWTSEVGSVHSSECETVIHGEKDSFKNTDSLFPNPVVVEEVDSKANFKQIGCATWDMPDLRRRESRDDNWCTFASEVGNVSWTMQPFVEIQSSSSLFGGDDPFLFDFDQKLHEWTTFSNNPFRAKIGSFCDAGSCESPASVLDVGFVDRLPSLQTQESWQFFSSKVSV